MSLPVADSSPHIVDPSSMHSSIGEHNVHDSLVNPYTHKKKDSGQIRIRTLPQYYPLISNKAVANNTKEQDTQQQSVKIYHQTVISSEKEENIYWGDSIDVKAPETTRIYFQNINGLRAGNQQSAKWPTMVQTMFDAKIDIAGFAETNVNWSKKYLKKEMTTLLRNMYNHATITTSRNDMTYYPTYVPGGTLLCSTGHWTSRVVQHLHDPRRLNRWSGQKLRLKNDHHVYILSAYRPVKKSKSDENNGIFTVHVQQHTLLRRQGILEPDPRQLFVDDLIDLVKSWQEDSNASILLMLDANEILNEEKRGISRLLKETGLIDILTRHHHSPCNIATCARSNSRRIDFILASPKIVPFVSRCGYLPLYHAFDSDHRGIFLDISDKWIDGKITLGIQPKRSISTTINKKYILAYKQYVISHFSDHKIQQKAEALYTRASEHLSNDPTFLKDLNELDSLIVSIALKAEKETCLRTYPTDWSPPIHQASLLIRYWVIAIKGRKNKVKVHRQLNFIKEKMNERTKRVIDSNTNSLTKALSKAKEAKILLLQSHKELREAFLEERVQSDSDYHNTSVDQATRRLQHKEQSSRVFNELREIFKKCNRSGISHIMVPDKDKDGISTDDPNLAVTWVNITSPADIENRLFKQTINHFSQAQGSVFTVDPLNELLGYTGTTPQAIAITEGSDNFIGKNISPGAIHILKRISNNEKLPPINDNITFEEFWSGIMTWAEKTSTSPSLRHLGHYKVLQCSDGNEKNYSVEDPNPSQAIMKVYYHMSMAALKSGNTLQRWCQSTTAMIEKTPGSPKINRLRVIHLFEADYNLILKILWARKLVWNSHATGSLNDGQAGSRPGRRAIDIVIQKEMKYLYARLSRTTLASMDNDAKSCYDRIIINLAMMISRYFGMSTRACTMQATTLKNMQFRLRTALGESERYYKHTNENAVHGSGQGSCASPCLWLLISSLLIDCLETLGGGMTLTDVDNLNLIRQWLDGYVDDTSLFTNLTNVKTDDLKTTAMALQEDTRIWASLLEASGGQLELSKCFYYILSWKFNKEGDPSPLTLKEIEEEIDPITIHDNTTDVPVIIVQKDVESAHKTLGTWKTMSGNESRQIDELRRKSDNFAATVRCSNLSRRQARTAYSTIFIPSISYCLTATNINESTLTKIQCQAVDAFLPAMGYDHCFPRPIVYGPRNFGGLNLAHLYTDQCTSKIQTMMLHLRANTTLGKIMRINLNWTQLYSGMGQPIFQSTQKITYMEDNWFLHIREFLITTKASITINGLWVPTLQRHGDKNLMDAFQSMNLQPAQLRMVNNWRIFFQALTLSDIMNAAGTEILKFYRKRPSGGHRQYVRRSNINWPVQSEPGPIGFGLWIRCIKTCFGMSSNGAVQPPLGSWHYPTTTSNSQWEHNYSPGTNQLYIADTDNSFKVYNATSARRQSCTYLLSHNEYAHDLPQDAIPVDVHTSKRNHSVTHRNMKVIKEVLTNSTESSFQHFVETSSAWSRDLLQNSSINNMDIIKTQLLDPVHPLFVVSDGGLKLEKGTYGVVIASLYEELMYNKGIAHGHKHLQSSFRSESYGMLCGIHTLLKVIQYFNLVVIKDKPLYLYSDNLGLVTRVTTHLLPTIALKDYGATDIDVELQILDELSHLRTLGFSIFIKHVKGHQDRLSSGVVQLTREAQLNIIADSLATEAYTLQYPSEYQPFPANSVMLQIDGEFITSKQRELLHSAFLSQSLRAYMISKFEWPENLPSQIWWSIHGKSIKILSHNDRMRIQKFIFNRLPTNKRRSKYYEHIPSSCSTCTHSDEDDNHIIRCLSPSREKLRATWLGELERFLSQDHTHPSVALAILTGLRSWLNNAAPPILQSVIPHASSHLLEAYEEQSLIGWDHVVRGRLTVKWAHLTQYHLTQSNISPLVMTTERWGRRIIATNWNSFLGLWERRNHEEHGESQADQNSKSIAKLLMEVLTLQATQYSISYVDQDLLYRPFEELEQFTLSNLSAWVRNARHLVNTYRIDDRKAKDSRKHTRFKHTEGVT